MAKSKLDSQNLLLNKLNFNNHFLDFHIKKEILAFSMIYFYQMKNRTNNNLIKSISILLSEYKNIDISSSIKIIKTTLKYSNNPVIFYKKIISN